MHCTSESAMAHRHRVQDLEEIAVFEIFVQLVFPGPASKELPTQPMRQLGHCSSTRADVNIPGVSVQPDSAYGCHRAKG